MLIRKTILALGLSLIASSAWATCGAIPLTVKDAANATQNISSATAADGNCKTYIDADTASQIHSDLTAAIPAGTNLIGKVGIDQTTPGTTNAVSATNLPTTVDTNSGNKSASTLRVVLATDQPANTNALKVDGSGVTQPVSGTVTTTPPSNASTNLTQLNSVGLGSPSNYGTSPGAVSVAGVNAFVTNIGSGTAGTPGGGVVTVQGAASMTKLLVTPDANSAINVAQVNGVTTSVNTGASGTGTQRVTPANDTAAGVTPVKSSVPVVNGGNTYNTVAASQTAQALTGGGGGATGDYLSHCVLQPTTTAAGTMTILDNAVVVFTFTTGTLSNLAPISIPIGALSVSGAWKVTTGANETASCFGKFT